MVSRSSDISRRTPCTLVRHQQGIAVGQALIPLVGH